jgi:hypothetical protein
MPSGTSAGVGLGVVRKLATVKGIDGTVVGVTNLFTVPTGTKAIITDAVFRLTVVEGFSSPPLIGIGIAEGEDDIFNSCWINVSTVGQFTSMLIEWGLKSGTVIGEAGQVIKLGIDTAAIATTYIFDVDLIGYLVKA